LRSLEEFGKRHFERRGETIQKIDGWIFRLPLNAANVRTVDLGIIGQALLREATLDPYSPQIPCH